jgi:hypothetical protein
LAAAVSGMTKVAVEFRRKRFNIAKAETFEPNDTAIPLWFYRLHCGFDCRFGDCAEGRSGIIGIALELYAAKAVRVGFNGQG